MKDANVPEEILFWLDPTEAKRNDIKKNSSEIFKKLDKPIENHKYEIEPRCVKKIELKRYQKFVEFIDIGEHRSAMMLEHCLSKEIRFLLLEIRPEFNVHGDIFKNLARK